LDYIWGLLSAVVFSVFLCGLPNKTYCGSWFFEGFFWVSGLGLIQLVGIPVP